MGKTFFLFLSFILSADLFSQFYIKGRVTDAETQLSLKGASVYINNTTKGSTTDDNGNFELGPFSPGRYEVVTSFVGYEPLLYSAEVKTTDIRITFRLEKKVVTMREVLIISKETRQQYLEIFRKNILGYSVAADRCEIRNFDEVQFTTGETKDEIIAFTDRELVIENPELGYTVYFELIEFYYNKVTTGTYFLGYTRYVDWAKDDLAKKKWIRKRKQSYDGSTVHFYRSLLKKQLANEGFIAYELVAPTKPKIENVDDKIVRVQSTGAKNGERMVEDSMFRIYSDSIYRVYELRVNNGWRVMFSQNTGLKNEVMRKRLIGQPAKGTMTGLRLRQEPVLLSERGILLTPLSVFLDGIWAYERLANMLPEDYDPE